MSYQILGRTVRNEHLALMIYTTFFGGIWLATRGGSNKTMKPTTVQQAKESVLLKTDSKDEEQFIMDFIRQAEKEDAAGAAGH